MKFRILPAPFRRSCPHGGDRQRQCPSALELASDDHPTSQALKSFADEVAERTDGEGRFGCF